MGVCDCVGRGGAEPAVFGFKLGFGVGGGAFVEGGCSMGGGWGCGGGGWLQLGGLRRFESGGRWGVVRGGGWRLGKCVFCVWFRGTSEGDRVSLSCLEFRWVGGVRKRGVGVGGCRGEVGTVVSGSTFLVGRGGGGGGGGFRGVLGGSFRRIVALWRWSGSTVFGGC